MAIKIEGAKRKAKVKSGPVIGDEKYTGSEPVWDTTRAEKFTDAEFDNAFRVSMRYYNYYYSVKDLKKYLVEWLRTNPEAVKVFDKETLDKYAKGNDTLTPLTACAIVKAHTKGMPLLTRHITYLIQTVKRVISEASTISVTDEEIKTTVKAPTIQDRLADILKTHILHFEELEDALHAGKTVDPKAYEYLTAKIVPQAMVNKILSQFEHRLAEIVEAKDGACEQLAEGYSHYKASDFKRAESFYAKLIDGITQYRQVKQTTKKARVKRPQAKDKIVAKLKYLKEEKTLKLASINPVDIIGATQLHVYNVKTRKLGVYVADETAGTLSIKGSTIIGFDASKSNQKTLRKPEVQLIEFIKSGKVAKRKFLDDIKAVEIKLTGRISTDTILLNVA